ncbi:MAG: chemotaxis protein CheX [Bacillota bacterium]
MAVNAACVFESDSDARIFMEAIVKRTKSFLEEEGGITELSDTIDFHESQSLVLKSMTAILTVEDGTKTVLAFSFDRELIDRLFEQYSLGIEIPEDEREMYVEETAGDMINIVVGNALARFQKPGVAFKISTPLVINEVKSISRYKSTRFYRSQISTEAGSMTVYCVTPGELYNKFFMRERVL